MGKAISVLVKYDGVEFKLNVKRPSLYQGLSNIAKGEWVPDENSQLFKWSVEKQ